MTKDRIGDRPEWEIFFPGDILYVLVGQEGESACVHNGVETREGLCSQMVIIILFSPTDADCWHCHFNGAKMKTFDVIKYKML